MGRVVLILVVVVIVVGLPAWYAWWHQPRLRRQVDRRQIVMDEAIQRNARDNYVLLEQTIGYLERLLAADETYTLFSSKRQREEAEVLVRTFNQKQLDK